VTAFEGILDGLRAGSARRAHDHDLHAGLLLACAFVASRGTSTKPSVSQYGADRPRGPIHCYTVPEEVGR
ncbi:MAG TPA: hypothetical protein VGY54_27520, partial [Polyangiaceae bacterium]|nr:hypothetical protein [Polyangiaceae bacterium]